MKASELIHDALPVLLPTHTVREAQAYMNQFRVDHLALLHNQQVLGLVANANLAQAPDAGLLLEQWPCTVPPAYVQQDDHIFQVVKIAVELHLSIVPVVNGQQQYLGAVRSADLLAVLATETGILELGPTIVLEMPLHDFTMAEIARIIESHNARILLSSVKVLSEASRLQVTLKLNETDLRSVLASLERFNYHVVDCYTDPEYYDVLKERYESLMHYLKF